tara:strand:+ start:4004 stop:4363 length:360 start_codon:yes stop_codon:yes gene_type:complete
MRAKRAHKQNMSTTVTSTSFNKLVRVDWSFVLTSAVSSSKSFGISKEGEGEEEGGDGDDIRSRVNLRLVFENEEDDEEQQQQKRKQREIKMELTLSQFYEFKRDLEIARKSLNDAEGEV